MVSTVIQELTTVLIEHNGTLPEEDNDTHLLLSYIALNIALVDKPLRISDKYHKYSGKFSGTLEVVYHANHELKWDQIQARLLLIYRHTKAIHWYPVRTSKDSDLGCEIQTITIEVNPSINLADTERDANAKTTKTAAFTESDALIAGIEVIAAYRGQPRVRAFDQHFNAWANETYMPYVRNEVLPSAADGGPGLEPLPGSLPFSYEAYLSIYQERALEPLPAPGEGEDGYEEPRETAVRTRAFHWHCCAWAHYKLGQLVESKECFGKATDTPFNRFKGALQTEARCPIPGVEPYPDQEYLLWQIGQQLRGGFPWGDGNLETLYWLSMALTTVPPNIIPGLARLFNDYLALMLQWQYYFVAKLKTPAFEALIRDCEATLRHAPAAHMELYLALAREIESQWFCHINDHPTATREEQAAMHALDNPFFRALSTEQYRSLIQQYVGA